MIKEDAGEEQEPEPSPPKVELQLEDVSVNEGDLAKFMIKVTGYPKPRISWYINRTHIVNVRYIFYNKSMSKI